LIDFSRCILSSKEALAGKGVYLGSSHIIDVELVKHSRWCQRRMTTQNKSLPPGRYPPIFFDIGEQLEKPRFRRKGGPLGSAEILIVLWGMSQRWSHKEIAHYANIGAKTARSVRQDFYEDPLRVFHFPVITRLGPNSFQCRFCSETRSRRTQAQRHFLSHVFAHEIAQNIDLSRVPEAL